MASRLVASIAMTHPASLRRKRVLVDATPLWATSGLRGIGRFLRDLLAGLTAVRGQHPELEIEAIRALSPTQAAVTADLSAVLAESADKGGSIGALQRHLRRAVMPAVMLRARADLLHLPEIVGTPLVLPAPMVATCHDLIPLRYPEHYLPTQELAPRVGRAHREAAYAVRWVKDQRRYRLARRVVAISSLTRDDLVKILKIPSERIDVVHNGITLHRYEDQGVPSAPRHPRPFILYVGFSDPRKNIPALFATLARLNARAPVDLVWAGDIKGKNRDNIVALAAAHGVSERLKLAGFVSDAELVVLYQQAMALVFLSRIEGFGLPVVEGMAAGCPVIVARGSGSDELVGEAGVHVSADDPSEAAEAVWRVVDDAALRARLKREGPTQAGLFSSEAMATGYVHAWRRALGLDAASA